MQSLRVAAIPLSAADFPSREARFAAALEAIRLAAKDGAELVCLPEMVNCYAGLTPDPKARLLGEDYAVTDVRSETAPFRDLAAELKVAVVLPLLIKVSSGFTNSSLFLDERGRLAARYDKVYPTTGELAERVRPGKRPVVLDWRGLRIGFAICFDFHFPELFRAYAEAGVRLILCSSMFAGGRILRGYAFHHEYSMLVAYAEWSSIIDDLGQEIAGGGQRLETWRFGYMSQVVTATLYFNRLVFYLDDNEKQMRAVKKEYGRKVQIDFLQDECVFALTSLDPRLPLERIVRKHRLIRRREFFARYRKSTGRPAPGN